MTLRRISVVVIVLLFFSSDGTIQQSPQPPYRLKIKALFTNLFPPNLDFSFRGSISNDEEKEGVAGDKVKEAVAKSLGTCKATVEESAKSAAKKLKDTLSSQSHQDL